MLMGSKSATGCRERERDVSDRLLLVDRVWVGYACVCARALERREKFHGGRVRRSRHFCIIAPGSDIQTGRRRLLRCCRFRKDSRPPSVRVLVRRISATSLAHIAVSFSFFSCSYTYGYQSRLQRGNSISRAIPIRYPWPCPVVHAICMGP